MTVALVLVASCGAENDDSEYSAKVVAEASAIPGDRSLLRVELSGADVLGSEVVAVAFDDEDLLCDDGEPLQPSDVRVGSTVTFLRVGGGSVETSDPPVIGGRQVRVDCTKFDGEAAGSPTTSPTTATLQVGGTPVTVTLGHCYIDPVVIDSQEWVQRMERPGDTGIGSGTPGFTGRGSFLMTGDAEALYVDDGGLEVPFVLHDGTNAPSECR